MDKLSKKQTENKIKEFFIRTSFSPKETRKIKRQAMAHNIKLRSYKKLFCKNCLLPLKGTIRVSKTHRTVTCQYCNHKNKIKLV